MSSWKDSFVAYFWKGIKADNRAVLGVEVEHFILQSQTREAVTYDGDNGVRQILGQLMKLYPAAKILPDEDFFGFSTPEFTITLEPAAQLEISIAPMESIRKVAGVYQHFRYNLDRVLAAFGYIAVTAGCQPTSHVADLPLLPKKRYTLMDSYFRHCGTGGVEMMRGTASVQVSIDYQSEADFCRKIQAAYFYSPLLKLLCDNSSSFQGTNITVPLTRTSIWRRVDPARCGILPHLFSHSYSFADYADFLGSMPPIFLKQGRRIVPTGQQTTTQLLDGRKPTVAELSHILSIAFPDVRLKQFLEVRVADSVALPFMLAYCALIKGLLYGQEGLNYAHEQIKHHKITDEAILAAEDALIQKGWKACIYGHPVHLWAKDLLALARRSLPAEEQPFLDAFYPVVTYGGIVHIPADIRIELERQNSKILEPLV
ncbi:MAG: hypothetical protein IJ876_08485 [Elusimicrobiaceae bacterium]|nr:hypothetical protein [Elusimicrobiaceae bacterium]